VPRIAGRRYLVTSSEISSNPAPVSKGYWEGILPEFPGILGLLQGLWDFNSVQRNPSKYLPYAKNTF